ncbi:hypothetical protein PR048_016172 [Dryococelus australis]|uniref:Uncharacterized protein n=1 Tax=Dryococelus australis TaxID=614101 RepID=A0ABQ9HJ54_9NEOP|nr:hypothetical protein PR048_016172 [Dryococelus australis]
MQRPTKEILVLYGTSRILELDSNETRSTLNEDKVILENAAGFCCCSVCASDDGADFVVGNYMQKGSRKDRSNYEWTVSSEESAVCSGTDHSGQRDAENFTNQISYKAVYRLFTVNQNEQYLYRDEANCAHFRTFGRGPLVASKSHSRGQGPVIDTLEFSLGKWKVQAVSYIEENDVGVGGVNVARLSENCKMKLHAQSSIGCAIVDKPGIRSRDTSLLIDRMANPAGWDAQGRKRIPSPYCVSLCASPNSCGAQTRRADWRLYTWKSTVSLGFVSPLAATGTPMLLLLFLDLPRLQSLFAFVDAPLATRFIHLPAAVLRRHFTAALSTLESISADISGIVPTVGKTSYGAKGPGFDSSDKARICVLSFSIDCKSPDYCAVLAFWVYHESSRGGTAGRALASNQADFLEDLSFPVPLHSGAAPRPPRFTLIGSPDLVNIRPNLFTPSLHCSAKAESGVVVAKLVLFPVLIAAIKERNEHCNTRTWDVLCGELDETCTGPKPTNYRLARYCHDDIAAAAVVPRGGPLLRPEACVVLLPDRYRPGRATPSTCKAELPCERPAEVPCHLYLAKISRIQFWTDYTSNADLPWRSRLVQEALGSNPGTVESSLQVVQNTRFSCPYLYQQVSSSTPLLHCATGLLAGIRQNDCLEQRGKNRRNLPLLVSFSMSWWKCSCPPLHVTSGYSTWQIDETDLSDRLTSQHAPTDKHLTIKDAGSVATSDQIQVTASPVNRCEINEFTVILILLIQRINQGKYVGFNVSSTLRSLEREQVVQEAGTLKQPAIASGSSDCGILSLVQLAAPYQLPRGPDLNPIDLYLRGHLKALVYATKVDDLETLRNRIVARLFENRRSEIFSTFYNYVSRFPVYHRWSPTYKRGKKNEKQDGIQNTGKSDKLIATYTPIIANYGLESSQCCAFSFSSTRRYFVCVRRLAETPSPCSGNDYTTLQARRAPIATQEEANKARTSEVSQHPLVVDLLLSRCRLSSLEFEVGQRRQHSAPPVTRSVVKDKDGRHSGHLKCSPYQPLVRVGDEVLKRGRGEKTVDNERCSDQTLPTQGVSSAPINYREAPREIRMSGAITVVVTRWTRIREDMGWVPGPVILISVFHGFPKSLQAMAHSFPNPSSLCYLHRLERPRCRRHVKPNYITTILIPAGTLFCGIQPAVNFSRPVKDGGRGCTSPAKSVPWLSLSSATSSRYFKFAEYKIFRAEITQKLQSKPESSTSRRGNKRKAKLTGSTYMHRLSPFLFEKRGTYKGYIVTSYKSAIAPKRRALNWRAVFS